MEKKMLQKRKNEKWIYISLIFTLNMLIYLLTLQFGGINSIISSLFYLTAILSGYVLGFKATAINVIFIGFLIRPLQFNQITNNSEAEILYWLFRLLLIVFVGLFVGFIRDKYYHARYMQKYQERYLEKNEFHGIY
jgi:uncharacterized membrane protein